MAKGIWISEAEAAARLRYKPRTLRKYAKSGRLDISYTSINGRNYHYDLRSIERLLDSNAVFVSTKILEERAGFS